MEGAVTMKTIKVRTDKKTGDCYLKLSDFKDLVDISKVKQYTLEPVDDDGPNNEGVRKALVLTFFDANGKVVDAK